MTAPPLTIARLTGACVLSWLRTDADRAQYQEYWRNEHARLTARTSGLLEYRQHHFTPDCRGIWPDVENLQTAISKHRRMDGVSEAWFADPMAAPRAAVQNRHAESDEPNVFARTILQATAPNQGRWYSTAGTARTGFRSVVLLRRDDYKTTHDLHLLVNGDLAPAIAAQPGITELRTQVWLPYQQWMWDTPVEHDYPINARYHAMLVIGAESEDILRAALASDAVRAFNVGLRNDLSAVHAYTVEATYTFRTGGRATIPALPGQPRPDLEPAQRTLPRAPKPAHAAGLPPSSVLRLPGAGKPYDVVADQHSRLLCGLQDGTIVRIDPDSAAHETVAETGGRPFALEPLPDGRILVCDAHRGLLAADPTTGEVTTLVQFVDGFPLRSCAGVAVQADGTIWFTESSSRFDTEHHRGALLEHRPAGRLFRRDHDGTIQIVLDNLYYPTGVTLTPDESALLVAETAGYAIHSVSLTGPHQGESQPLLENMAGFPTNISRFRDGRAWVGMSSARDPYLDDLADTPAFVRQAIWRIPEILHPKPHPTTWAISIDPHGTQIRNVHGQTKVFHGAASAAELGNTLYLASPVSHDLLAVSLE